MGRLRKGMKAKRAAAQSAREKKRLKPKRLNALRFCWTIITNGASYEKIRKVLLWNDLSPPKPSTYAYHIKHLSEKLVELATMSAKKWKSTITPNSACSFDGSWLHRRNSTQCVVEIVDVRTNKIVGFSFQEKNKQTNTEIAGNGLEVAGLRQLIPEFIESNFKYFIHDKDGKATALLGEAGWNLIEILDPNHAAINLDRRFDIFNKENKNCFYGLKQHLLNFFKKILRMDASIDEKIRYWFNIPDHFLGHHDNCPFKHKNDTYIWNAALKSPEKVKLLNKFLNENIEFIKKSDRSMNTQFNESFHVLKAHYVDKLLSWKSSWQGRIACAILDLNEGPSWRFSMHRNLKLPPLRKEVQDELLEIYKENIRRNTQRRTEEYRHKENIRRKTRVPIKSWPEIYLQ